MGMLFFLGPVHMLTEARIKEVFSASVRVELHQLTGVPHIIVMPRGDIMKKQ